MLRGEVFHQIDAKGRVRIPGNIKAELGADFVVTKGTDSCLFLFPRKELETNIYQKLLNVPISDIAAARPLRMVFSSAAELEEDNQGRSLLPKNLREHAKIQKDVVFIGVGNRAELWAREVYDRYMSGADFDKAFTSLKDYGV